MTGTLFLAHRIPYPPDRGDKVRSFHVLRHLAARGPVHLVAFADDERDLSHGAALSRWCASQCVLPRRKPQAVAAAQALATGRPVSLAAFDGRAMRGAVRSVLDGQAIDRIYVYSGQMAQHVPADRAFLMDFVDVDSAKFAAYAADAAGPMRWMLAREARLLARDEAAVAARASASLFVSEAEAALFRTRIGAGRVFAVENGIDTAAFAPDAGFAPVADAAEIVFTGQMDYRPNIDAVCWFAERVLPAVRAVRPATRFAIVGRRPAPAVRGLAAREGVVVTGEVADVRGWIAGAAAVVAPLRIARGVQNKVLEAMAMARPVVASPAAAEGIDHAGTLAVADAPDDWVAALLPLLDDRTAGAVRGARSRERAVRRYGWDARLAALDPLLTVQTARVAA